MDFYGFIEAIEYIAKKLNPNSYAYNKKQCMTMLINKLKNEFYFSPKKNKNTIKSKSIRNSKFRKK